jgi:hypothetical protein
MKARLLMVVTALAFAACSKCGKSTATSAAGVERLLPRTTAGVLVIPNLQALGERLKGLESLKVAAFSAQLNGFKDGHEWADALVQQLGIDVRSKEALEKAGLDPAGGAGLVGMLDESIYLVVPVKDEAKLAGMLQKLSAARLGAGIAEDKKYGDVTVHAFVAAAGAKPRLGYAMVNGFALIGSDESVPKLSIWATLAEADSLSKDEGYAAALGRLPKDRDLVLYFPSGSPALRESMANATATLALRPEAITLTADVRWTGDPKALELLVKQAGPDLLGYLPEDAWLVAKFSGDPAQLAHWIERLVPHLKRAFDEAAFDVNGQVLANLKPGAVAGLSLAPTARMSGMPELDLRSTNPFTYAHLTGATEVKDAQKVPATLELLSELAPRIGSKMVKTDREGQPVYFTTYSAGEGVHLAAKGPVVFFGSPAPRVDALLKSDGKASRVARPSLKAVLDSRALTLVVDLQKLAFAVRELPSSAWGIGGFAIKATTLRWLDATDDLEAITAGFESKGGAVQAQLVLSLTPPGPQPKAP